MGTANVVANTADQFGHWSGNSDAINFVHHGVWGAPKFPDRDPIGLP